MPFPLKPSAALIIFAMILATSLAGVLVGTAGCGVMGDPRPYVQTDAYLKRKEAQAAQSKSNKESEPTTDTEKSHE